ncbi:hypothetical protein [Methanococcoides methylutens]|uniref:hypothetical protein n=1 Tax=Methanococcoides methylutens TaxID=2226 RepID=UPI0012E038FE|nr:hypothetical protein [Methanococcoides methylutens]
MGLEDRDYYREKHSKKERLEYIPYGTSYRSFSNTQSVNTRKKKPTFWLFILGAIIAFIVYSYI